jgi:hypothetical protein
MINIIPLLDFRKSLLKFILLPLRYHTNKGKNTILSQSFQNTTSHRIIANKGKIISLQLLLIKIASYDENKIKIMKKRSYTLKS